MRAPGVLGPLRWGGPAPRLPGTPHPTNPPSPEALPAPSPPPPPPSAPQPGSYRDLVLNNSSFAYAKQYDWTTLGFFPFSGSSYSTAVFPPGATVAPQGVASIYIVADPGVLINRTAGSSVVQGAVLTTAGPLQVLVGGGLNSAFNASTPPPVPRGFVGQIAFAKVCTPPAPSPPSPPPTPPAPATPPRPPPPVDPVCLPRVANATNPPNSVAASSVVLAFDVVNTHPVYPLSLTAIRVFAATNGSVSVLTRAGSYNASVGGAPAWSSASAWSPAGLSSVVKGAQRQPPAAPCS